MSATFTRIKADFWLIYFTLAASMLTDSISSFNSNSTKAMWWDAIVNSMLIPLIAMGIIYYIVRVFTTKKWWFN